MRTLVGLVGLLGLLATPAAAQKVVLDYAHDFDFKEVETFQYVDTKETNIKDSLMAGRVVDAIKKDLLGRGLDEVENGADLVVTYHYSSQQQQSFSTTTTGMGRAGMGAGWVRWVGGVWMSTSTTRVNTFTEGTLVIDAYDPDQETLVWRGSGTVTVKNQPDKQMNQVNKIIRKLGHRWDKIRAGKGK